MLRAGIAGIGFMGWIHYLAYQRCAGVEVQAICSRDAAKRQGDWRGIQGNFGPPGEQIDTSGWRTHETFEQLLADDELDVIDLCLSPHLHADAAVQAFESGKHVFCEKPMALTTEECARMLTAADAAGKQLLIGHMLPMVPEYAQAIQWIQSGDYGRLLGGSFKRIISDPLWLKDFFNPRRAGGPLVDLHVHDAHLIRALFGMPNSVISHGRQRGEVVEFCQSLFGFADPSLVVHAVSGVIAQQSRPFTQGFEIHLEQATILFESAVIGDTAETLMPLTLLTADAITRPQLPPADPVDAFVAEIREVARSIDSGQPSELLGGRLASDALTLCHAQTQSVFSGQAVRLD